MKHSSSMNLSSLLLLLIGAIAVPTEAFFVQFEPVSGLKEVAKTHLGTELELNLAVGEKKGAPQLALTGLKFTLSPDDMPLTERKKRKIDMPGAHGPFPQVSSGVRALHVTNRPAFVDMNGRQEISLEDGSWEINWKDTSPAGALVCGFNLPKAVQRNSAKLPAGKIFLTIPVWTPEGLAAEQARKQRAESTARQYRQDRDAEIQKMQETTNLFQKALHYRKAAEAVELLSLCTPLSSLEHIPDMGQAIRAAGDFLLSAKGHVWTMHRNKRLDLGNVMVRPILKAANETA